MSCVKVVDDSEETSEPKYEYEETSERVEETEETHKETSTRCENEHGKIFSFQPKGSTAMSYVKPYCEDISHTYLGYSVFRGTPDDLSYLEVIQEHSDGDTIVPGEYYTMSAEVSLKFYNPSSSPKVGITCKVKSEKIIVSFHVEFKEEFREQVKLIQEGDIVTFRGRFYDEGCGFTDCELILE